DGRLNDIPRFVLPVATRQDAGDGGRGRFRDERRHAAAAAPEQGAHLPLVPVKRLAWLPRADDVVIRDVLLATPTATLVQECVHDLKGGVGPRHQIDDGRITQSHAARGVATDGQDERVAFVEPLRRVEPPDGGLLLGDVLCRRRPTVEYPDDLETVDVAR